MFVLLTFLIFFANIIFMMIKDHTVIVVVTTVKKKEKGLQNKQRHRTVPEVLRSSSDKQYSENCKSHHG